ncbi:BTB/POZ domain-containing protein At3g05675-like [Ananas comosus]|uniref:BTB/POZ domain-containing protein At3g05675-like n=1 Tax=Ananas comosus TaxID=4615 RepID=A0A6P5GY62_ANACO|nr:BTB/POZ domain-containing protein At3g05675-like [Ananas comosus]XP_020112769.1 BTB/POZ domain-containing protein At3g05675-like [Ananas comosus]XP_020112770.1 BTB/POZ domain-containing protein At3g05675-like [Ananas comosus]XP_020112771.1 BTB/POZ domain-containing protein At3g05675-like [Ananas comosus]XP_020112772.1 BTB/POZ domain-containing protein At3g05675-like [Ananas comosus]XP_020112773.1 BTB/POZ domain-containing protein At3g05675-like [Ananas comosus]XP_020112774.1 BTB/POZ domain
MDQASVSEAYIFGDQATSDITICLQNKDDRPEWFHCHSPILIKKSRFFSDQLVNHNNTSLTLEFNRCIEVQCPKSDYDHYVKLLNLLYLSEESLLGSFDSVKSTLGILRASISLQCESIIQNCIEYLEAVPWDEKEEEDILSLVPSLGPRAFPILARVNPVNNNSVKNVFLSAIRFATNMESPPPPFLEELKTSAQEQIEYMLLEDEDTPLVVTDEDVKSEVQAGLEKMFTTFKNGLESLPFEFDRSPEQAEQRVLYDLADLEWISNVLPKIEMMKDFVSSWIEISQYVIAVVQGEKYNSNLWAVKAKLIEVTGKALDAVGYGSVVLPTSSRVEFINTWLPYLRKMKPLLDSKSEEDEGFCHKIDGDVCQNIEGAIVSLVLALPSSDQAEILAEWMSKTEQLKYPDLSEAFEVWCYRTKTAKRRLMVGLDGAGNNPVSF